MSDDAIAMEKARRVARERSVWMAREHAVFGDHMNATNAEIEAALREVLYDAYLTGWAACQRGAKDAVAATIRAEVPERRARDRDIKE